MGIGAGLYMYVVVVQKFTFAISSPDEFLSTFCVAILIFITDRGRDFKFGTLVDCSKF